MTDYLYLSCAFACICKEIHFVNELYLSCQFLDQPERNAHVTVRISVDSFTQM